MWNPQCSVAFQQHCWFQPSWLLSGSGPHSLPFAFLRHSTFLTCPTYWGLSCTLGFTFTASHIALLRAHCLVPQTFFWNQGTILPEPTTLILCMPVKPAPCDDTKACWGVAAPSWIMMAEVSECLDGWNWGNISLCSPNRAEWPWVVFSKHSFTFAGQKSCCFLECC